MQKYVNLVDLIKSFPTSVYLQKSASIQPRTSPSKLGGDCSWSDMLLNPLRSRIEQITEVNFAELFIDKVAMDNSE